MRGLNTAPGRTGGQAAGPVQRGALPEASSAASPGGAGFSAVPVISFPWALNCNFKLHLGFLKLCDVT